MKYIHLKCETCLLWAVGNLCSRFKEEWYETREMRKRNIRIWALKCTRNVQSADNSLFILRKAGHFSMETSNYFKSLNATAILCWYPFGTIHSYIIQSKSTFGKTVQVMMTGFCLFFCCFFFTKWILSLLCSHSFRDVKWNCQQI